MSILGSPYFCAHDTVFKRSARASKDTLCLSVILVLVFQGPQGFTGPAGEPGEPGASVSTQNIFPDTLW